MKEAFESSSSEEDEKDRVNDLTYVQEQELLKKELKNAISEIKEEEEEDLLVLKNKTKDEELRMEEEYKEFLAKQKEEKLKSGDANLTKFWKAEDLTDQEKFLRDFILNNGWVDEEASSRKITAEELDALSDSEEALNKADDFEAKYNFRHEDPEGMKGPQTFPRDLPSMRGVKQTVRQRARERKKQQKVAEKLRLDEELKKLKAEKRKEIMQKVKRSGKGHMLVEDEKDEAFLQKLENLDDEELEKYLDEYLQIDYEDVSGVKARFKYDQVKPETYGLEPEEIVLLDDKILQNYVPIKALAPHAHKEFVPNKKKRQYIKKQLKEQEGKGVMIQEDKKREKKEKKSKKKEKKKQKKQKSGE